MNTNNWLLIPQYLAHELHMLNANKDNKSYTILFVSLH